MKILGSISLIILFFVSCGKNSSENQKEKEQSSLEKDSISNELPAISDELIESAVIYEANIRQYSEEGSFKAFTRDIPVLKDLGVKILWLMPVYPISTTKSKGTLGSYYAVSDYTKVNPEFGTIEDFRDLVKTAHANDIYVVLDWVANHTGWDHKWIKEHPEYYTKNEKGEITHTVDTDWTDVADLNYENQEMRNEMRNAMKYWVTQENVDGFRCDVAGMVPNDFWKKTISELREIKPVFMLAEAWEPELLENGFDMVYGWDTHHVMNAIAKGEKEVKAWDQRMKQIDTLYTKDAILMNFTSNHDENSWNGTVEERMGEAKELFAALTYVAPGMPLIYSGQEYDLDKRLLFFEKDTIIKKKDKFFPLYIKLGKLKNTNKALDGGKNKASYKRLEASQEDILSFERNKNEDQIIFIGNLSENQVEFNLSIEGKYNDYLNNETFTLVKDSLYQFDPWEYRILVQE